ncbi:MAG: acylneuraminate cytidylyltransferase family protein [Haliscomenobacteraceae bacterium CHB4]|nr:acylneuraminate cytidylyltransferase family protein [Haliscomenobacteraceae bacterium CHB4]
MPDTQKIIALIPARGGSKSIPKKNIRSLGGAPLLAYSIAAGLQSERVDRVIVSTDCEEIAEAALEWGAEVPFLRPAELAEDATTDFPVFEHAIRWLEDNEGSRADIMVQLRPTSPLRPPRLVDTAIDLLLQRPEADSVRCVTPSGQNPFKMWRIEKGMLQPLLKLDLPEPYNQPRQALPESFWQTGHVEVIRCKAIMQKKSLTGDVILPCLVPPEYAIDLDNLYQWDYAEHVLAKWNLELVIPFLNHIEHIEASHRTH